MNLHGIVSGAISAINPLVPATVKRSAGYTTNPDGTRIPAYSTFAISAQVQALSYNDLVHLEGLNIQGVRRAMYLTGNVMSAVRVDQRGGDLIVFAPGVLPEGTTWLAAQILEQWPDWVKVCITLQDGT